MAESKEELKSLLMKVKERGEKDGLKLNIQKMMIMASSPITSWQINGETVEAVTDFILGGSKIIADADCNHEIKRLLLLGRKAMTNLDSVLKSRGTSLLKKVHIVKNYGTHSSTLAWKLPWMEESGRLQSMGSLRVGHDWETSLSLFLPCIGEGNGNPLQCSCLENPRDGEAWWAAVCGVAQSRTRLTRLSSSLVAAWFFQ